MENKITRNEVLDSRVKKYNIFKKLKYNILTDTNSKNIIIVIDERRGTVKLNIVNRNDMQDQICVSLDDRYWVQFEEYFKALERVISKDFNVDSLEQLVDKLETDVIKRDVYYIQNNIKFDLENNKVLYENGTVVYTDGIENYSAVDNEDVDVSISKKAFLVHGQLVLEGVDLNG